MVAQLMLGAAWLFWPHKCQLKEKDSDFRGNKWLEKPGTKKEQLKL